MISLRAGVQLAFLTVVVIFISFVTYSLKDFGVKRPDLTMRTNITIAIIIAGGLFVGKKIIDADV